MKIHYNPQWTVVDLNQENLPMGSVAMGSCLCLQWAVVA